MSDCKRCAGKTVDGTKCKRPASCRVNCTDMCWQHAKSYKSGSPRGMCVKPSSSRRRSPQAKKSPKRKSPKRRLVRRRSRSRSPRRVSTRYSVKLFDKPKRPLTGLAKELAAQMKTGQWTNIQRIMPTGVSVAESIRALREHEGTHFEMQSMQRWRKL